MEPWEPEALRNVSARMYQRWAAAQIDDLRLNIEDTRRVIEESRKLLDRLAAKPGANEPLGSEKPQRFGPDRISGGSYLSDRSAAS